MHFKSPSLLQDSESHDIIGDWEFFTLSPPSEWTGHILSLLWSFVSSFVTWRLQDMFNLGGGGQKLWKPNPARSPVLFEHCLSFLCLISAWHEVKGIMYLQCYRIWIVTIGSGQWKKRWSLFRLSGFSKLGSTAWVVCQIQGQYLKSPGERLSLCSFLPVLSVSGRKPLFGGLNASQRSPVSLWTKAQPGWGQEPLPTVASSWNFMIWFSFFALFILRVIFSFYTSNFSVSHVAVYKVSLKYVYLNKKYEST